jgi:type IV secretory pathway TraG/TraD family ATPase VirD4
MNTHEKTCWFAQRIGTRGKQQVGISTKDRRYHFYAVGKTGMGKSTMLENMIISDILNGRGVGLIDPHGDLAQKVLAYIPSHRINQVIYFNPADTDYPIAFNLLEKSKNQTNDLLTSSLISVFKKTWIDSWGPRLEHLLRNTILALLTWPSSTLIDASRILTNERYRSRVIKKIQDPIVKSFWVDEFSQYPDRFLREVISPLQNKLGALLSNQNIRNIVGQAKSSFSLEHVITSQKIFIANLSKGLIGEDVSKLLGTVLVTRLQLAAMKQAEIPEDKRKDFYLYIDEFHNFSTPSFIDILSEARKYRLNLILAHQYLKQLDSGIKEAVLGNAGTVVAFRLGADDARELEYEFQPNYGWLDLVNLFPYEIYAKLMIDGNVTRPYYLETIPPFPEGYKKSFQEKIINYSRSRYCKPKQSVEKNIHSCLNTPTA